MEHNSGKGLLVYGDIMEKSFAGFLRYWPFKNSWRLLESVRLGCLKNGGVKTKDYDNCRYYDAIWPCDKHQ